MPDASVKLGERIVSIDVQRWVEERSLNCSPALKQWLLLVLPEAILQILTLSASLACSQQHRRPTSVLVKHRHLVCSIGHHQRRNKLCIPNASMRMASVAHTRCIYDVMTQGGQYGTGYRYWNSSKVVR